MFKYEILNVFRSKKYMISLLIFLSAPIIYVFIDDIKKPCEVINSFYGISRFFINYFLYSSLLILLTTVSLFEAENKTGYRKLLYSYPIPKRKYFILKYFAGLILILLLALSFLFSFLLSVYIRSIFDASFAHINVFENFSSFFFSGLHNIYTKFIDTLYIFILFCN